MTDRAPSSPTVLMGFAEAFAAVEVAWSLQSQGMKVMAFTRPAAQPALRHVPGVQLVTVPPPEQSVARTLLALDHILRTHRPDALLPLDDGSLWLSSQLSSDCPRVGPDPAGAALALDKAAQITGALAAGIPTPPTDVFPGIDAVEVSAYPAMLKPVHAVRVEADRLVRPNGRVVGNEPELTEARRTPSHGRILVQPLLAGVGEGVFGYVDASGPRAISGHRRIRMVNPQGSASSACESVEVEPTLLTAIQSFLRSAHWSGMFMVELLRDDAGFLWFMELNGRPWGSLALARRRGFEYPAWATQVALDMPVSPPEPGNPPHIRARHLGREMAHLAFVLRGPRSTGLTRWPSRGQTVRDLVRMTRDDRLYNWDRHQPVVVAADTWRTLADLARNSRSR